MNTLDTTSVTPHRPPNRAGERHAARIAGFTLIEILMTIAVAGIIVVLAMPSFRYVTVSNRIAGEINGLLGDLQFARAEAIKEGQTVTVCVSAAGKTCDGTTTWQNGWIVFQNPANVLRIQPPFSSTDSFVATQGVTQIQFNREGYAAGLPNGTLISVHDATGTTAWTRCLAINFSGQMSSLMYNQIANLVTCT
jgi:type IV fimbrial biogenesis protein FimT